MTHNIEVTNPKGFRNNFKSFSQKNERNFNPQNLTHNPTMPEPKNNMVALKNAAAMPLKEHRHTNDDVPTNNQY